MGKNGIHLAVLILGIIGIGMAIFEKLVKVSRTSFRKNFHKTGIVLKLEYLFLIKI